MILEGANGTTLNELKDVLQLPADPKEARTLLSALHKALNKVGITILSYICIFKITRLFGHLSRAGMTLAHVYIQQCLHKVELR